MAEFYTGDAGLGIIDRLPALMVGADEAGAIDGATIAVIGPGVPVADSKLAARPCGAPPNHHTSATRSKRANGRVGHPCCQS